jgi:hypothetical protein
MFEITASPKNCVCPVLLPYTYRYDCVCVYVCVFAAKQTEEETGVTVRVEVIAKLSVSDQIRAYGESMAVMQNAGGGCSTAIFLPKGATFVQIAPKDRKDDYILWGHMSHIKVDWVETDTSHAAGGVVTETMDTKAILALFAQAVRTYHNFNPCYDSQEYAPPPHIAKVLEKIGSPAVEREL